MTRNLFLIGVFFFTFSLSSCSEDEPGKEEKENDLPELSVDATEFSFEADGGSKNLNITSNGIWSFEYDKSLWARPSIQTAKGDATIKIMVDENTTEKERSMSLSLTIEGLEDIVISVAQEKKEPDSDDPADDPQEPVLEDYIEPDNTDMRDLTSLQLSELMGLGWNLGNSLEAINANGDELSGGETSWGNPVVTKELVNAVKEAGFNTIRIPVSWSHKFDEEGEFDISYEWKLRVEEVVNYALDNDMFVLINIHWDGGWMNHPDYENQEEINDRLAIMWKQIAKFFRDYDDRLLFAGTNEVHVEGDYGAPSAENAEVQNSFNQTFVNTVRATGGRNTYRHLVIQSYNTNIEQGVDHLSIPEDETEDRLMVEVHFYDPYQFTLEEGGDVYLWGAEEAGSSAHAGWGDEEWVDEAFDNVKTNFVDQGYPVILGEYGALLRTNLSTQAYEAHVDSRNYYLNYVTKKAIENGMIPVYWDNGYTGNNGFGLFDRASGEVVYQSAIDAIVSATE